MRYNRTMIYRSKGGVFMDYDRGEGSGSGIRSLMSYPLVSLGIIIGIFVNIWGLEHSTIFNHGQDYTSTAPGEVIAIDTYDEYVKHKYNEDNGPKNFEGLVVEIEFEANGLKYISYHHISPKIRDRYSVGQQLNIRYNPDDPQKSGVEGFVKDGSVLGNIGIFAGIGIIIASIIYGIKLLIDLIKHIVDITNQRIEES